MKKISLKNWLEETYPEALQEYKARYKEYMREYKRKYMKAKYYDNKKQG